MKKDILRQFFVIFTTIFTLALNGAANALPLNGRMTGEISDSFNVLFVPAGYVFSIWGLIYLGLTAFVIHHSLPSQRDNPSLRKIGWWVVLSNLANVLWIYFWHFGMYSLSLVVMLVLLVALLAIYLGLNIGKTRFSNLEKWVVSVPFSIYLGWITIATIANISQALYASGYTELGLGGPAWATIMIAIGTVIISAVIYTGRGNIAYALATIWAVAGLALAQWERSTLVGGAAVAAIVVIVAVLAYSLWQSRSRPAAPAV